MHTDTGEHQCVWIPVSTVMCRYILLRCMICVLSVEVCQRGSESQTSLTLSVYPDASQNHSEMVLYSVS